MLNSSYLTRKYNSIDPAPAFPKGTYTVPELKEILLDTTKSLFERYRAMFSLRDDGSQEAIDALASGFEDTSALFRHEIAYVFGQMQDERSVPALIKVSFQTSFVFIFVGTGEGRRSRHG